MHVWCAPSVMTRTGWLLIVHNGIIANSYHGAVFPCTADLRRRSDKFASLAQGSCKRARCARVLMAGFTHMQEKSGAMQLLAANAGDSRVLLVRGGQCEQLSTDHVPDDEDERLRIEATNPNPKRPMVRVVHR